MPENSAAALIEDDPGKYLEGVNYLDPKDPIDTLLIDYQQDIASDSIITAQQQRVLIAGLKGGNLSSARELVNRHMGLVAAVAYPFKPGTMSSDDLMRAGVHALIKAAKQYDKDGGVDFSDYAAAAVHDALKDMLPDLAGDSYVELHEYPMEGVYRFTETVCPADTDAKMQEMRRRTKEFENKKLTPVQARAVPLLHLTAEDMSDQLGEDGVSLTWTKTIIREIRKKLGASTKEEAALIAYKRGFEFDILDIEPRENFTVDERLVGMRLWKRNADIAQELGFSEYKISKLRQSLTEKTHARSRAELLLMAHANDFEPTDEELNPPELSLFERLDDLQKEVIGCTIYMKDAEIGELPGIDLKDSQINTLINEVIRKSDLPYKNRPSLVLELHRQGMEFDVMEVDEPLSDLLYAHELDVARLIHLPYEEIDRELSLGLTVEQIGGIAKRVKRKLGARSRQELALIVEIYDDGSEALEATNSDNRWRLARYLGLKTLESCDIDSLLGVTTKREREVITAYYLADDAVTWAEVSELMDFSERNAHTAAVRGIGRMIRKLNGEPVEKPRDPAAPGA